MSARLLPLLFLSLPLAGSAQFGAGTVLLTGDAPDPLTAIDLDNDGDLDLVRLDAVFGLITYTNFDGQGGFSFGGTLLGPDPAIGQWALGDLNADGLPDVAAQLGDSQEIHVALNLGDGVFGAPQWAATAPGSIATIAVAELSGDGLHDLVFGVDLDGQPSQLLWSANLDGAFAEPVSAGGPIAAPIGGFIRHGDLDHLGGNDLLITDGQSNLIVLRNTEGDGSIWAKDDVFSAATNPFVAPQLLDADGDGDLDLAEAGFPEVRWMENTLGEGGVWAQWTEHQLEPWTSAGPGAFGRLGCGTGAGAVVFPLNPDADVRYTHWAPAAAAFAFANAMALPRGEQPLLADVNGDGRDDLLLYSEGERLLFLNELAPATMELVLPALPDLCKYGQPFPLPEAAPTGGHWMGPHIFDDALWRASIIGSGVQQLAHIAYEPQGCPAGATSAVLVVEQPLLSPTISGILCASDEPIQFSSIPPATEWVGTDENGLLDPVPFQQGVVVAIFTDASGETCATESEPYVAWPSMPAQINPAGPFCVNSGAQLITAVTGPGIDYSWAGSISGFNSAGATFLPSVGAGVHPVVLIVEPNQPGYCEGLDTLWVSVSDEFPEVTVTDIGAHCGSSAPIDLAHAGAPLGGTWSGPAVDQGFFLPAVAGAGSFTCTYTYFSPTGCSSSEALEINIVGEAIVTVDSGDLIFCTSEEPAHFTGFPAGGAWTVPIDSEGTLDPAVVAPGDYPVLYTWTGADGCTVVNATATLYVLVTTEPVIDPVGILCSDGLPVQITGSPEGLWSGSVSGSGPSAWFDPGALGVGLWPVTLTAAEAGECSGSTTVEVLVELCTGVDEAAGAAPTAWPNPFGEQLYVEAGAEALARLELRDATGRLVHAAGPVAAGARWALPAADAPAGPCFLHWMGVSGRSGVLRLAHW